MLILLSPAYRARAVTIREFGRENKKTLLFFPGSYEPWQEFAYAAKELAARFHVLLVTPDGHDPEEGTDFISVEKTVDDTVCWLKSTASAVWTRCTD